MTPQLDLPEGINVAPDEDHDYIIEIWRRLAPDGRAGATFERLGYIDTFSGHVHMDTGSRVSTVSREPQVDVDWVLRRALPPHGPDGRAVGHPLA